MQQEQGRRGFVVLEDLGVTGFSWQEVKSSWEGRVGRETPKKKKKKKRSGFLYMISRPFYSQLAPSGMELQALKWQEVFLKIYTQHLVPFQINAFSWQSPLLLTSTGNVMFSYSTGPITRPWNVFLWSPPRCPPSAVPLIKSYLISAQELHFWL